MPPVPRSTRTFIRWREADLASVDAAADARGLTRSEFIRRAALAEARKAMREKK